MSDTQKHIFIVAGEPSGDKIASGFMRELKKINPQIKFSGIAGVNMKAEGMESLFPLEELSVMGIIEVLPKLFKLISRINFTAKHIVKEKPDAVVFMDAPDFCFRVAKKVKKLDKSIPLIHYVAPTVWAWRPKRAKKISKFIDHLLTLFPFEPPYFSKHGLNTVCVGHPVVERPVIENALELFRKKHSLRSDERVLTVLPGSRNHELDELLQIYYEALNKILEKEPQLVVVIPTLPHLKPRIKEFFKGKGINPIVITDEEEKFSCFAASSVAIAASGTVSLELASMDTPHLITYKVNKLTASLARLLVKTKYYNIINIMMDNVVIPELLQEECDANLIAKEIIALLKDKNTSKKQSAVFEEVMRQLGRNEDKTPSQKVAEFVLSVIDNKKDN